MFRAKNYKTMSKYVKVTPRKLWLLFFWTRRIEKISSHGLLMQDAVASDLCELSFSDYWQ